MKTTRFTLLFLLLIFSTSTPAKDYALTVYGGYRGGGAFTETGTDNSLPLDSTPAFSVALDMPYDSTRQYQLFVSHQRTGVVLTDSSITDRAELGMNITYVHIGGTNFFTGPIGKGPYMVGGIGATWFDPADDYDSELRASMNLGFGYQLPLGETLALRFEARGYATLVNSSGGFFCSGGCVISISGDTVMQAELMLGVTGRF